MPPKNSGPNVKRRTIWGSAQDTQQTPQSWQDPSHLGEREIRYRPDVVRGWLGTGEGGEQ